MNILLYALSGALLLAVVFWPSEGGMVTVPNLVGLSEDQARQSLQEVGLTMQTQDEYVTSEARQVTIKHGFGNRFRLRG